MKIVSIANPVKLSELKDGILRDYKMESDLPPDHVFLEFCRQACRLQPSAVGIFSPEELDCRYLLSESELYIAELLKTNGGLMSSHELSLRWTNHWTQKATLHQILCSSPIIVKHSPGMYGLVGIPALGEAQHTGSEPMMYETWL